MIVSVRLDLSATGLIDEYRRESQTSVKIKKRRRRETDHQTARNELAGISEETLAPSNS